MKHKLFASMAFALCALIYLTFILIIYIGKRRKKTINKTRFSNFFPFLLIFNIVMAFAEIFYIYTMSIRDLYPVLCEVACRIYILIGTSWLTLLLFYIWSFGQRNVEDDNLVKKRAKKILAALFLLLIIINAASFFGEIEYSPYRNDFYVFGGPAVNAVYVIGSIVAVIVIITMIVKKDSFPVRLRRPVYFTYGSIILLFAAEIAFDVDYNFLTFIYAFIISTLFFTFESQDYQMVHELEDKRKIAEQADKAKTTFLSNISHSIRTPMTTILGQSDILLLNDNLTKENSRDGISDIYDSGNQLLTLINNILDVSRIESGKEEIEEKEYKLENLIFEVNSLVHSKIKKESIDYSVNVDQNLPSKYYGDYIKLYKILSSIILNAINYTEFGNIILDINGEIVENHMEFTFKVSNSGHEMEQKNFDKDIDELGSDDSDSFINLYVIIAKRLTSMLGGTIEFLNEPGKGTQYTIKLNQKIVDFSPIDNVLAGKEISTIHRKRPNLNGKKILIVDDNQVSLKISSRLIKNFHAEVLSATSGQDALELAKSNKFDMIFLDHMMPDMDGITTLKLLKETLGEIPPVIALTASSSDENKAKYREAGFNDYLQKPINNGDLIRLMVKYFVKDERGE